MKRKVLFQLVVPLLSLCVLFLLLATDPGKPEQELAELSVIFREEDPVWSVTRQGMEQAAADMGAELRFRAPTDPNDAAEQRTLLERELEAGARGVILIPADRSQLRDTVDGTNSVVVTLESAMEDADVHIGVDNEAVGREVARSALNGVPEGGWVLLLSSAPGDNGVQDRLESARAELEDQHRHVIICGPSGGKTLEERLPEVLQICHPNAILAFEASALELAVETVAPLRRQPLIYGAGSSPAIAAALEQSRVTAIQAQDDFSAGYLAVVAAVQELRHERVEAEQSLPFLLVRQENMYNIERQKLLFPVSR